MGRFEPFESSPRLAVAVSGGRDSMALVLLASVWARARGGEAVALTVDHGLRNDSAAEAATVRRWMDIHGIRHEILTANGLDGRRAIEAGAREARYALLETWCRDHGVLHLLVGHHHADQLETQAMRAARSDGPIGPAGMATVRETGAVRILRPFLETARERLTATLSQRAQDWIEDPSNADVRFERVRLRRAKPGSGSPAAQTSLASGRVQHEERMAGLAAQALWLDPAGFATLDREILISAPSRVGRDLLGRVVTTIGGGVYPPRGARLNNLWVRVCDPAERFRRTLSGCLVEAGSNGDLTVLREAAAVSGPVHVARGPLCWDNRFRIEVRGAVSADCRVCALGHAGAAEVESVVLPQVRSLPREARRTLPALYAGETLVAGPEFGPDSVFSVRFAPRMPVAGSIFAGF